MTVEVGRVNGCDAAGLVTVEFWLRLAVDGVLLN